MPDDRKKYMKQMALFLLIFSVGEGLTLIVMLLTPVLWLGIILAIIGHILFISGIVGGYFSVDAYLSYKPMIENNTPALPAAPAPAQSMQHDYVLIILYKKETPVNDQEEVLMYTYSSQKKS